MMFKRRGRFSMGRNVLVTKKIPREGIDLLQEHCDTVDVNPDNRVWSREELMNNLDGHDAVLCLLTDTIDREVLDRAQCCGIKVFANLAVGYDNIAIEYADSVGIKVTNTPGILTITTAELTWALIFAVARRIVEADAFTRKGKFTAWDPLLFLGHDISGKTLGIIGAGRIGTAVAMMSQGFDMEVCYYDLRRNEQLEQSLGARKCPLESLLGNADIISLHTPLTPETHHLIGKNELALMKPTAILVNAARGTVVDEAALVDALREKRISGAGLDVYEEEPKIHPELPKLNNVVLLPHIGSATYETRGKMARMAAENIIAVLEGTTPPNLVSPGK